MINVSTKEILKAMHCTAMATEFERQLTDQATYGQLGFEERFALIVDAEWNRRQANKLARGIRNARFSEPGASIEGIEYYPERRLDKAQMLRFATCKYIDDGHHIILSGASGGGKTYIACALGNAACRKFKKVQYIRMPELLDEWLIRPLAQQESYNMLEIVEARANSSRGSMIFCTQYETADWYGRIDPEFAEGSPISEAIMDRIIHNAYNVFIAGNVSMRKRHGLRASIEREGR